MPYGCGRIVEVGDGSRPGDVDRDVGDDAPGSWGQDDDPIGDQDRLGDAVGDHDDGRCRALPESQQLEVEAFAAERIERAERFIEQEHRGLERQGTGERHTLGGPAGQLGRAGVRHRRVEVDEVDQRADPCGSGFGGPAGQVEGIGDVVGGRAPRQQARLLEDQPDTRVGAFDR